MHFSELARYFKKLEETPSRNSMTEILADLFRHAQAREIGELCYLLQGRVVPLYEAIEFGVADQFMIRAIALAYGVEEKQVRVEFKKVGDLGVVAESIRYPFGQSSGRGQVSGIKYQNDHLHIREVYKKLYELALASGEGSQEKKITLLADLFKSVDALSARYIARIPLGKLRLGFSDMTILDALSWMEKGDKSVRGLLEDAYNVRPDIGLLAKTVKEHGVTGLSHIKATVGAPILASLCQRIPNADDMIKKMGKVAVEPKYDGVRCVGGYTGMFIQKRGYISARDVHKDDHVLTHTGDFKKITGVARRYPYKRELVYRLQTMLGDSLVMSGNHPVLRYQNEKEEWVPVQDISSSDWVLFPKVRFKTPTIANRLILKDTSGYKKSISLNEKFFRLLGFWIGDGFSNNSHQCERVGLTFNAKTEKTLAAEYEQIIKNTLHIQDISRNERNGGLNLYWRDSIFRVWLTKEFRYGEKNGDHGKCIPEWMFGISRRKFLSFMRGWYEADGTERHGNGRRITTKEHRLASMGVLLGFAFQYPIGLRKTRVLLSDKKTRKTYYELHIPGTQRYIKQLPKAYVVKIHSNEKIKPDPRAYLYDFEVEGDKSFCVSLAALHNCQIHYTRGNVTTFSRNLENTTAMFPELEHIAKQIDAKEVILDSEAVGVDPKTGRIVPFQETMTRKRKHEIEAASASMPLRFFVFDILYKDGTSLLEVPLSKRRSVLEETIHKGTILEVSPQIVTTSANELREYHDVQLKLGLEGAVIKKWESPYEPGRRGYSWVKFKEEEGKTGKLTDTIDAVIMGYSRGEGKRSGFGIGMFLVGVRKADGFVTVTKVGTGVSDELWKELHTKLSGIQTKEKPKEYGEVNKLFTPDVWVAPRVVVEIAGDDLTRSPSHGAGFAVRFPRLVGIRTDKSPREVTTVEEIRDMFAAQGNQAHA